MQHTVRQALTTLTLSATAVLTTTSQALAADDRPARGAPLSDLVWGAGVGTFLTVLVLGVAIAHRSGRITWLSRLSKDSNGAFGLPGWSALPLAITRIGLFTALFGYYWDVTKHIDTGRDASPFGTAAHYPIIVGLGLLTLGGLLAVVLGSGPGSASSLRLAPNWRVPLGGALIFLSGAIALVAFPLDDLWHTLFGQDVTLWGPTHVMMIGAASLSTLGIWILFVEGLRASPEHPGGAGHKPTKREKRKLFSPGAAVAGGFLIGLSTLQGEFDFGVPQFQLLYHPILLMLAAGAGLVAARIYLGRGGALKATLYYIAIYAVLSLLVGPVLGGSTLHFPLYIVEALLVEAVALKIPREKQITLGAVSGAVIGTVGLAAEWAWSYIWMPLPWPQSLLPEAALFGLAAALAGGLIGGYIGRALTADRLPRQLAPRWVLPLAGAVAVACIAYPLPMTAGSPTEATVQLRDIDSGPQRTVEATVKLEPRDAAEKANWLTVTAWQGGGLHVDRLEKVATGVYRTTEPIPVHGSWKAMVRMENGRALQAMPIFMPKDSAIPAAEIPAQAQFTRPFVRDKKVLQREAVAGSDWLTLPAYLLLLTIFAVWLAAIVWGLARLESTATGGPRPRRRRYLRQPTPPRYPTPRGLGTEQ